MGEYKIIFSRKECIGAAVCESFAADLWTIQKDGKADLHGAKLNEHTGKYELVIDEKRFKVQDAVARSCPAGCIAIERA